MICTAAVRSSRQLWATNSLEIEITLAASLKRALNLLDYYTTLKFPCNKHLYVMTLLWLVIYDHGTPNHFSLILITSDLMFATVYLHAETDFRSPRSNFIMFLQQGDIHCKWCTVRESLSQYLTHTTLHRLPCLHYGFCQGEKQLQPLKLGLSTSKYYEETTTNCSDFCLKKDLITKCSLIFINKILEEQVHRDKFSIFFFLSVDGN